MSVARNVEFWLGSEGIFPANLTSSVQRTTAFSLSRAGAWSGKLLIKAWARRITSTMAAAASSSLLEKCL